MELGANARRIEFAPQISMTASLWRIFPAVGSNPVRALAIPPVTRPSTLLVLVTCRSADRSRLARRTSFIRGAILPDETMESESGADNDSPFRVAKACPSTAAVLVDVPPWPWLPFRGLSWEGRMARKGYSTRERASHALSSVLEAQQRLVRDRGANCGHGTLPSEKKCTVSRVLSYTNNETTSRTLNHRAERSYHILRNLPTTDQQS